MLSLKSLLRKSIKASNFCTCRSMSADKDSSIISRVERRIRHEIERSEREMTHAVVLRKEMMTEDERLIFNLRRAKKRVSLLLEKLEKFQPPELPPPLHDPEVLTPEQLQAYQKIGFKNKTHVPIGVRGIFGGVVQNMHLHWKFHETVHVCCDNYPKERIKDMALMLARLSGGIVVNIHDSKTIIMFRGRNYRQPKSLIPFHALTKRKALFRSRYQQALEAQKLNIMKIENCLRGKGINPDDPVAISTFQRIACTFIQDTHVPRGTFYTDPIGNQPTRAEKPRYVTSDDDEQQELDQFIAEIEEDAEKQLEREEVAEREEYLQMKHQEELLSSENSEDECDPSDESWEVNAWDRQGITPNEVLYNYHSDEDDTGHW